MRRLSKALWKLLFEWHSGRGLSKLNSGEYERALRHIERALSFADDVRLQIYRAIALSRIGEVESALQVLNQSEAHPSKDVATLILLARAYDELGMYERTRNLCEAALKVNPRNLVAISLLALALLELGELDEALKLLSANEIADDAKIQSRMLAILERLAKERRAPELNAAADIKETVKELISRSGEPAPFLSTIASWWYAWRGMISASKQDLLKSITYFARAFHYNPNNFNLRFALVILLLDAGMSNIAQMLVEDVGVHDTHPDYHLLKGAIQLHLGELDDARVEFGSADQSLALTHYYLGLCELYSGSFEDAIKEFERAFELDPALVRERLRELVKRLNQNGVNLTK
ncbi:MAG: tetratricopeptide repeat protein [Armatimonadota bacterium]|nr:tetratricopeptide repeat protein [Armatimonadota bacterium]MCX7777566.1 tetratricopeptide repeat protein [Armatimonadota bacterium]MDW8025575.1 tetratricopeptide repeat protein [Armatimonadota bacterium]